LHKLKFVDALRGYAILGVVLVHTAQFGKPLASTTLNLLFEKGAMGVQLFFIASAFTLFRSFDSRVAKEKFAVINFFIRRFFRIAPLFYIAIVYFLFQNSISNRNVFTPGLANWVDIFCNFIFVNGFTPYGIQSIVPGGWSITVEVVFYAMLPFLL
jgi:peptidoglycan/LPS O-acetylase OafA/YrhL